MRSRSFLFASVGVLALALAFHFGARSATAQSEASEIAILSGTLPDGGVIPLPVYADGVQAQESDCRWTVSPATLLGVQGQYAVFSRCSLQGREVRVYTCLNGCVGPSDCVAAAGGCPQATGGTANYFIVAVRNLAPTPARQESMGAVKARYR